MTKCTLKHSPSNPSALSVERSMFSVLPRHPSPLCALLFKPRSRHTSPLCSLPYLLFNSLPITLFVFFVSFVVSLSALSQSIPPLINYQGRLADSNGVLLPTADYALEVRIYTNAVSGAAVWGPQLFDGATGLPGHGPKIPVVQGYFNVILGPSDTNGLSVLSPFSATNTFVSVATNGVELSPRQRILSVPYAAQAYHACQLNGPANIVYSGEVEDENRSYARNEVRVIPGWAVQLTPRGRPVLVSASTGYIYWYIASGGLVELTVEIHRIDTASGTDVTVGRQHCRLCVDSGHVMNGTVPVSMQYMDSSAIQGREYSYEIRIANNTAISITIGVHGCGIWAMEL